MPRVSVIVPVYNAEKHLARCLDSVRAQTLIDIEILCIDDGSMDRSPEILNEYAERDPRIHVTRQTNAGPGAARNVGIERASGEYVLFVDADDAVAPELAARTVDVAENEEADMTFFFMETNHANGKLYDRLLLADRNDSCLKNSDLTFYVSVCAKLWRTEFLKRNKLKFSDEFLVAEDTIFHWAALASDPKVAFVFERFYKRSTVADSLTYGAKKHGRYAGIVAAFEMIRENLKAKKKYDGEWKRRFLYDKLRQQVACYYIVPVACRPSMIETIREKLGEDERKFLRRSNNLPWHVVAFYQALDGSRSGAFKLGVASLLRTARDVVRRRTSLFKERLRKISGTIF